MDPVSLIVTALVTGAVAGLKPTATAAVKDAYAAFKRVVIDRYKLTSLGSLEEKPDSAHRQAVVKEDLEATSAGNDSDVLTLARKLLEQIALHDPKSAAVVGVDLQDVTAASIEISRILSSGDGVRIKGAQVTGNLSVTDVTSGGGPNPK